MGEQRRVLLKLSGEVFGGGAVGIDADVVQAVAREIALAVKDGIQVAVVVGGGNFFRGAELSQRGFEQKPWHRAVVELGGRGCENTDHMVTETLIRGMYDYWRKVME